MRLSCGFIDINQFHIKFGEAMIVVYEYNYRTTFTLTDLQITYAIIKINMFLSYRKYMRYVKQTVRTGYVLEILNNDTSYTA